MNSTLDRCWPVTILLMLLAAPASAPDDFEKHVCQLLVEKCQSCHGAEKAKGGLQLDSWAALLKGGETIAPRINAQAHERSGIRYFVVIATSTVVNRTSPTRAG